MNFPKNLENFDYLPVIIISLSYVVFYAVGSTDPGCVRNLQQCGKLGCQGNVVYMKYTKNSTFVGVLKETIRSHTININSNFIVMFPPYKVT